ncbi:hypothetical protein ARMA_2886 [Ardenticatena maritima]|uniref:Uncharacterized protein n=1 Tax=Ardenticatena maritima TaxID=872965 RepID=A0A0M8K9C3_9CHLR|nr:hypothetical protein [Ardenticatena maritima]GAP64463.1 hypothetical protein ARMA_2886 [Ardenticatena maritima]
MAAKLVLILPLLIGLLFFTAGILGAYGSLTIATVFIFLALLAFAAR